MFFGGNLFDSVQVHRGFDGKKFLAFTLPGLEPLSLLQRLRRATEALHATLPEKYPAALEVLLLLAPRFGEGFTALVLPDFVGLYGREDFDRIARCAEILHAIRFVRVCDPRISPPRFAPDFVRDGKVVAR